MQDFPSLVFILERFSPEEEDRDVRGRVGKIEITLLPPAKSCLVVYAPSRRCTHIRVAVVCTGPLGLGALANRETSVDWGARVTLRTNVSRWLGGAWSWLLFNSRGGKKKSEARMENSSSGGQQRA